MATRQAAHQPAASKRAARAEQKAPSPPISLTATHVDALEPRLRPRRNPRMILIGILCAAMGALILAWAWGEGQNTQEVLIAGRQISKGQVVTAQDLAVTTIGSAVGAAVVPANQLTDLVGKTALVDLPPGSVVGPAAIGSPIVQPGMAHVGLRLPAGRLPSQGLPAGTHVIILRVASDAFNDESADERFEAQIVNTPTAAADGQHWLVDIALPEMQAARVAVLASSGQVAVIRRADR